MNQEIEIDAAKKRRDGNVMLRTKKDTDTVFKNQELRLTESSKGEKDAAKCESSPKKKERAVSNTSITID